MLKRVMEFLGRKFGVTDNCVSDVNGYSFIPLQVGRGADFKIRNIKTLASLRLNGIIHGIPFMFLSCSCSAKFSGVDFFLWFL